MKNFESGHNATRRLKLVCANSVETARNAIGTETIELKFQTRQERWRASRKGEQCYNNNKKDERSKLLCAVENPNQQWEGRTRPMHVGDEDGSPLGGMQSCGGIGSEL